MEVLSRPRFSLISQTEGATTTDDGGFNGGPTQTVALQSGSRAIDAVPIVDCTDQASPPNPIITDQRSFPRPDAGEANSA